MSELERPQESPEQKPQRDDTTSPDSATLHQHEQERPWPSALAHAMGGLESHFEAWAHSVGLPSSLPEAMSGIKEFILAGPTGHSRPEDDAAVPRPADKDKGSESSDWVTKIVEGARHAVAVVHLAGSFMSPGAAAVHATGLDAFQAGSREPQHTIAAQDARPAVNPNVVTLRDGSAMEIVPAQDPDDSAEGGLKDAEAVAVQKEEEAGRLQEDFRNTHRETPTETTPPPPKEPPDEHPDRAARRHPDGRTPDAVRLEAGQVWRKPGQG